MKRAARWLGYFGRVVVIGLVTMAAGLWYGLGRLRTLFIRGREARGSAVARLRGRVLRRTMTVLGATFIKLGQVMSTRPDLFRPEFIDELRALQDRLPPFRYRRVREIVEGELGAPINQRFSEFDTAPVAAASVAQVHRARLPGGEEVAVKVLRPDVRAKVERDAAILIGMARVMALHPKARSSDPVGHLAAFVEGIIAQTDLAQEARNYEIFRANFASEPAVIFPEVYETHSTSRIMTMAFCRGHKVDALPPGDHSETARVIRDAFLKMCFEDGFLHVDLHPGNMLATGDGTVAIFDVGLTLDITEELLEQFVDFAKCVSMGDGDDFVDHLRRFHTYMDDVDWVAIQADAARFVERFRAQKVSELEWGAFINDVCALARRHKIRPVPEMALVLVGIVTAEGLGKMLNPNGNSFQEMAAFLMPILARRGLLPGAARAGA